MPAGYLYQQRARLEQIFRRMIVLNCHPAPGRQLRFVLPYSPQTAKASLKARSPGAPFSIAMMARRWLV